MSASYSMSSKAANKENWTGSKIVLVGGIKRDGLKPEKMWPSITRKTQLAVDAVMASIEKGFEAVDVVA
ncbi:hypothetical protein RJ641_031725 [Dillenia turbinata]|uniref:Uncharacterized protein n=1 Tax=Dillenia turbinata TaxID=194707 RepID=A0AAN8W361_9MAGN